MVRQRPTAAGDADLPACDAVPGDPPQRIAWKAYARNDHLLLKEFSSGTGEPCLLAWDLLPELGVEQRLSQLARWCLDADAAGRGIALRLPGQDIPPGVGPKHLAVCLEALALATRAWSPRRATRGAVADRRDTAASAMVGPSFARDQSPPLYRSPSSRHELAALATLAGWMPVCVDGDRLAVRIDCTLADSAAPCATRSRVGAFCSLCCSTEH